MVKNFICILLSVLVLSSIAQVPTEALLESSVNPSVTKRDTVIMTINGVVVKRVLNDDGTFKYIYPNHSTVDTNESVSIYSLKAKLEKIKNDINQNRYSYYSGPDSRSKSIIKGAGTVLLLSGVCGFICTIINVNHTEEIPTEELTYNSRGSVTGTKTVNKEIKNKWNSAHTGLAFISGGTRISGCITLTV